MFFCNNCQANFNEPNNTYYEDTFYSHGPKVVEFGGLECPHCGSEDYQESVDCLFCDNPSQKGVCENCLHEQANLENALLIQKECKDKDFIITQKNAKSYCFDDIDWFVDWLIQKGE